MVSRIGFEPGSKSNTLKDSMLLTLTPGRELDSLRMLDPFLTTINAHVPARLAPFPLDAAPLFLGPCALERSSASPKATRTFRRSRALVIDSRLLEDTIGKSGTPSTRWPLPMIRSFWAVAAIAEKRPRRRSFLFIFLWIIFHDSGGCAALPALTPATPAACPALLNPWPRILASLAIPRPVFRDSALTNSPAAG